MDFASRGSYDYETEDYVQSEGHKACVALLEEAMNKVSDGR